jgi:hypothetical protein
LTPLESFLTCQFQVGPARQNIRNNEAGHRSGGHGTRCRARSKHFHGGEPIRPFLATVASPVVVDDKTVIPKDALVKDHIVDAQPSGYLKGVARLELTLDSVEVSGQTYEIATGDFSRTGKNHNKRNGMLIGSGAGAVISGVAGGGVGALIGSSVGAGAGTAGAAFTGKKDIRVPAQTTCRSVLLAP